MTIQSRPYQPNPEKCCEACCFGGDDHSPWCEHRPSEKEDREKPLLLRHLR
jgi:hypothetical protein